MSLVSLACDSILVLPFSATNELAPDGTIQSFTVGPEGAITLVATTSTAGAVPSYCVGLSTGQVAVPNVRVFHSRKTTLLIISQYGSGTASVIPTEGDYLHFSNNSDITTFPVPTTGIQGAAEPHMVYPYGDEIFIPDKVS